MKNKNILYLTYSDEQRDDIKAYIKKWFPIWKPKNKDVFKYHSCTLRVLSSNDMAKIKKRKAEKKATHHYVITEEFAYIPKAAE